MSMHLVGPYMTTTSYKKRKAKKKTKKQIEADARHEKWLRKMNAHPEQIANNKEKKKITFPSTCPSCNQKLIKTEKEVALRCINFDFCEEQMRMFDIPAKWKAFGWNVKEIDGHNMNEIM